MTTTPEQVRWERTYYNSYGNYGGYRFQDFRGSCSFRIDRGRCTNSANELGLSVETPECLCKFCPLVEIDIEDGDDTDYSEGEQPILVHDAALKETP